MFYQSKKIARRFGAPAIAGVSLLAPVLSHAAAVDVSAVVTDIAAQAAPVGLVGAAVLMLYVAVKAFKWVRGALS